MTGARLHTVGSGLAPATEGWFVVSLGDAAWLRNDGFGGRCTFEAGERVVSGTGAPAVRFDQLGIKVAVLEPGKPSGRYHYEDAQEAFLVLAGECVLRVEGEERALRQWDFFHCPPGTAHGFVGAGDGPCLLLMAGARVPRGDTVYPEDDGAPPPRWVNGRPDSWDALPFA